MEDQLKVINRLYTVIETYKKNKQKIPLEILKTLSQRLDDAQMYTKMKIHRIIHNTDDNRDN